MLLDQHPVTLEQRRERCPQGATRPFRDVPRDEGKPPLVPLKHLLESPRSIGPHDRRCGVVDEDGTISELKSAR